MKRTVQSKSPISQSRNALRRSLVLSGGLAALSIGAQAQAIVRDWNVASGSWSTSGNWSPTGSPGGLDTAFIGSTAAAANATVTLNTSPTIAQLSLTDGMTLDTNAFTMQVGTSTSLAGVNTVGTTSFPTTLRVENGAGSFDFRTDNMFVNSGARLNLISGGIVQVDGSLQVDGASELIGNGIINFTDSVSPVLVMDGTLTAAVGGLTLNQLGTGRIDLDGGAILDRRIDVTDGNLLTHQYATLTINGDGLADTFDDSLRIGGRNTVNMNLSGGWTMSSGTLEFGSNAADPGAAVLNGSTLTMNGSIAAIGLNSFGQINSPLVMNPFSRMTVNSGNRIDINGATTLNGGTYTLAQGARLTFNGPTAVKGGTYSTFSNTTADGSIVFAGDTTYGGTINFSGVVSQNGNAVVNDYTVIAADSFDLDGFTGNTLWNLNAGLVLNAGTLDSPDSLAPEFDGTININHVGGILGTQGGIEVNLPIGDAWTMAGSLNLGSGQSFGITATTLKGSQMKVVGSVNVAGSHASSARIAIESGGVVTIANNSFFQLAGGGSIAPNLISGGLIQGAGALLATSGHPLIGYGTINAPINFDTGADLYANDGTLQINGQLAHVGYIGVLSPASVLHVANAWNTSVASGLRLYGGSVVGGTISNAAGTVIDNGPSGGGTATIASQGLINDGSIIEQFGRITIDTIAAPDLDGASGAGKILISGGMVRVTKQPADPFDGYVQNYYGTLQMENGWTLGAAGTLEMHGPVGGGTAFVGGTQQLLQGHVIAVGDSRFDISSNFVSGATISIPIAADRLILQKNSVVSTGVTFSGNGILRNETTATLTPAAGSNINVALENAGTFVPAGAATPGIVAVKSLSQLTEGRLLVDLGGPTAGTQYDRVVVTGSAQTGGQLQINTLNGYNPTYLLSHEILHTGGARSLEFSGIGGVAISPTKYWAVTYDSDSVLATAAMPGDANLDGSVNLDDFTALAAGFGSSASWVGGNFNGDGQTNLDDFTLLAANFGTSVSVDIPRGSAVPEPTLGALLAASASAMRRRRRDR